MASLYELRMGLMDCFDQETGELIDEERFNEITSDINDKVENVGLWVKNLEADVAAYKAEKKRFDEKIKKAERKIGSLEGYLADALGGRKYESARVSINFRKSETVEITDPNVELPEEYVRVTKAPDKAALKDALKAGVKIDGVELREHQRMQVK